MITSRFDRERSPVIIHFMTTTNGKEEDAVDGLTEASENNNYKHVEHVNVNYMYVRVPILAA